LHFWKNRLFLIYSQNKKAREIENIIDENINLFMSNE